MGKFGETRKGETRKILKEISVSKVINLLRSTPWPLDLPTIASHLRVRQDFLVESVKNGTLEIVSLPLPHAPDSPGLLYTDTVDKKIDLKNLYAQIYYEARQELDLHFDTCETRKALLGKLNSLDLLSLTANIDKYVEILVHKGYNLKRSSVFEKLLKEDQYKY